MDYDEMVLVVENWFNAGKVSDQQAFLDTPEEKLFRYHNTLGRKIRNEFKLWETNWNPEINSDGVDKSSFHPDQISMSIIVDLWKKMKMSDLNS